jgi:two-component sensor histidine kinase
MLGPQLARSISLALHELATNAMKYGALSNSEGVVDISWTVSQDDEALSLHWNERGGPPVVAPKRRGFGTSLIRDSFTDVRIDYASEGLRCEIVALLHNGSRQCALGAVS